MIQDRCFKI